MFDFLANPVIFIIVALVLCIALYGALHQLDLRRGKSLGIVEENTLDYCYRYHELVRVGRQVRLMALVYSRDGLKISRHRILATVDDQGSMRANLAKLEEKLGGKLTMTTKVVADLVPAGFTQ